MKLYGWRESDDSKRRYGFKLWWKGGEVSLGKRLYRFRLGETPGTVGPTYQLDGDIVGIDGDGGEMKREDFSFWSKEDIEVFDSFKAALAELERKKDDDE